MQIKENAKEYDAIIVGSGAGGGMTARRLAENGLNIAIIEAGPFFDPTDKEMATQLRWPWESPRRGASTTRPFGDFNAAFGGWDIPGEPYTTFPGTDFQWFRSRMLGGRTNHWGRISLRFGPDDFKHYDKDGIGANWPITYDEVKPWYDKVDKLIGIFGTNEGLPNDPDGFFLPPPKPRLHEMLVAKHAKNVGVPFVPSRLSIVTKKVNDERGLCFYCGQCSRSCMVKADFSSSSALVIPAMNSAGHVDLYTDSMAREVITDSTGRATGVSYVSKEDRREYTIKGKVVVLAAGACETARLLLNSRAPGQEQGLGNGSGVVGRYLHDSTGLNVSGFVPSLMDRQRYNEDGVGGLHVYAPWWLDNRKLDFPRGYHIEVWGGLGMPSYGFGGSLLEMQRAVGERVGGYGRKMLDDMNRYYGAHVGMAMRGESVAMYENHCEIDPSGQVDEWGIPILRFNYKWTDYEYKQAQHAQQTLRGIMDDMGAELISPEPGKEQEYGLLAPGQIIHEVGTARMGDDPKTSVTDKWGKLHESPNVFISDAAVFSSQADKNPTWTILALAWRQGEHIVEELKKMNI
ncbi:GMC family oxidoreductase [Lewinella sp. IMCC34191]|uniref:GMC family oxidoreductase n=1 Tax=Lewinella sp. IMCC34191 TaxID=2259172 RepID=UPI000E2318F7|nr:GMC family oxidoreductase [Lewinella sp. IMCC34191]